MTYKLIARHNGEVEEPRYLMEIIHNGKSVWEKDVQEAPRALTHGMLEAHDWMVTNVQCRPVETKAEALARRLDTSEVERLIPKDSSDKDPRLQQIRLEAEAAKFRQSKVRATRA